MSSSSSALTHSTRRIRDRIPTSIYEDNYGFTINFYQPMIDYLDAKQQRQQQTNRGDEISEGTETKYPHLPWTNERGLKKYQSYNSVRAYTNDDIAKYSRQVAEHAKSRERDLEDYKIIHRSPLAVTKSAIGARLAERLGKYDDNIEQRTIRKLQEREDERRVEGIMSEIGHIKARFNAHKDLAISNGLKSAIRGKTANQIAEAILAESEKNIQQSRNEEDLQISEVRSSFNVRKGNVTKRTTFVQMVDDQAIDKLDSSVSQSLSNVKRQLESFTQRTSDLYYDSRWRKY